MKKIYNSKWFPRLFSVRSDGGKDSGVTAYFLIEWKPVISIGLLHFKPGTREAYHSHAFNALTWWLQGSVTEVKLIEPVREFGDVVSYKENEEKDYIPSIIPKYTSRDNFHKVIAHESTYALTIRGPWKDTWREYRKDIYVTLTHGRKEVL
jgi:hypothetical protein